jgi:hypothetical protein
MLNEMNQTKKISSSCFLAHVEAKRSLTNCKIVINSACNRFVGRVDKGSLDMINNIVCMYGNTLNSINMYNKCKLK